jgi:hypothetical protein
MEQRALLKYVREESQASTQILSKLVEHYGDRSLSYLILMSAIEWRSFAWGEKALKIRDPAEDRHISKLISESMEHSKHRPMLQFETLLRILVLLVNDMLCPHSSSSSGISWLEMSPSQIEQRSEANKSTTCCFAAGRV